MNNSAYFDHFLSNSMKLYIGLFVTLLGAVVIAISAFSISEARELNNSELSHEFDVCLSSIYISMGSSSFEDNIERCASLSEKFSSDNVLKKSYDTAINFLDITEKYYNSTDFEIDYKSIISELENRESIIDDRFKISYSNSVEEFSNDCDKLQTLYNDVNNLLLKLKGNIIKKEKAKKELNSINERYNSLKDNDRKKTIKVYIDIVNEYL